MFRFIKRIKALEEQVNRQEKDIEMLKLILAEKRQTISQRTTERDCPVPFSQVMDEWLNGGKEEDNGN